MRAVSVHAFVDESFRDGRYLLTAALVDPRDLGRLRRVMRELLLPGQRELHFQKEKPQRRRHLIDRVTAAGVRASVYTAACDRRGQEAARAACLRQLVRDLLAVNAHRLVMDSRRERDRMDAATIRAVLGSAPSRTQLTYEHLENGEPLIWIADVVGWCHGAGGDWQRHVAPAVTGVIDCTRV
jgi:hypothetical protein